MGGQVFRSPEEGLDKYKQALDLVSLIREITQNPKVGNTVKELSQQFADLNELTEEKKLAAKNANEVIANANNLLSEMKTREDEHQDKVDSDKEELKKKSEELQKKSEDIAADFAAKIDLVKKAHVEVDKKLAQAAALVTEARTRHSKADNLESVFADKVKEHDKQIKDFLLQKEMDESDLKNRISQHEDREKELEANRKTFEIRKKRFDDALKE